MRDNQDKDTRTDQVQTENKNPCGRGIFRSLETGAGAHPASYTIGNGSFQGVKRPGRGVDQPPQLGSWLKKEWSYTSTPPLCLLGRF